MPSAGGTPPGTLGLEEKINKLKTIKNKRSGHRQVMVLFLGRAELKEKKRGRQEEVAI